MHAHGQRHENQERLPPPVRAVAGHVARGQWKQHRGNAELICLR